VGGRALASRRASCAIFFTSSPTCEETGVSILLVEQNARGLQIADYDYILEMGEFVLEGLAAELAVNPRVVETYLGLAASEEQPTGRCRASAGLGKIRWPAL